MEKRIRIIWLLSLLSALLLIVVQAYWLMSQYQYTIDTYSEELRQDILRISEEEFEIRKRENTSRYKYTLNIENSYKAERDTTSKEGIYSFAIIFLDSLASMRLSQDSIMNLQSESLQDELNSLQEDPYKYYRLKDSIEATEPEGFRLTFQRDMPKDSLFYAIDHSVINYLNPFRMERLDSLIANSFPQLHYSIHTFKEEDSALIASSSQQEKGLFHSSIHVMYVYGPLEMNGVVIHARLPVQLVFKRMGVQLLVSFGLILLLIGCLVFQIKTILKQNKLTELRQSFVNTMIHELKRPVQTLKTFVSFLGDKDMRSDEEATGQVVQDSLFELDNLTAYLTKLKDMVRADDGKTLLNPVRFDLQELIERVIRLTHIPAGKEVKFVTAFDMESPLIKADPVHVANIVSNLIENAIKYSGKEVEIEIKARRNGQELWLTVSDNGIGIPLIDQDKVFAKFYRGSNLPDRNIPGLGLGLSYVKLISEAHRGNVSIQSRTGEGTSITLFLPQ